VDGYQILLRELKLRIRTARLQAALAVNQELILLYLGIGREILERQAGEGWGSRVIDRLSADLRRDFPDVTGLSARNLKYMRALAEPTPTTHLCNRLLHDCRGATSSGFWRTSRTLRAANGAHGRQSNTVGAATSWSTRSRATFFERQGKALTNFSRTLPGEQSELVQQLIKDPYSFDFLPETALLRGDRSKIEEFKPEFAGKINFYLSAVDE
jgi:predicted nuclease of restriction endonuclease-like (RecB) superfamily